MMFSPMCPQAHIIREAVIIGEANINQKTHLCHKTKVRFLLRKSDEQVRRCR